MKDLSLAYVLALLCFVGPAGLHRLYLGRYVTGILYLLTWGFVGFGTAFDLIKMRDMVDAENFKLSQRRTAALPPIALPEESPERRILQAAQRRGGRVTVAVASLEAKLDLDQARKELERLRKAGHCELDVSEDGAELYVFTGLGSTTPLLT